MLAKLHVFWTEMQSSLWFIPGVMTLIAALLALITVRIDEVLLTDQQVDAFWVFGGGPESAHEVLSTIASGIITVTGVVFSVTIIALQLASSQFSPRVLRNFMGDRANQVVLGVFIGTFTYTILVLRAVRIGDTNDFEVFVPSFSVAVAIVMVLISIGFLIFFIDHTARSIQASTIISRAATDALRHVDNLFPEPLGKAADEVPAKASVPTAEPATVTAEESGYLQEVDEDSLFSLAEKGRLTIRMEPHIGDFVLPGAALVSIWPPEALDDDTVRRVRRTFVVRPERSTEQDVEFGMMQLVDVAVKALSPSINDPTTAKQSIDRLTQILVVLGNRAMPVSLRTDEEGRLLFLARRTDFARAVDLAYDQIRQYGAGTPSVAVHLLDALGRAAALVPVERRAPLAGQAALILAEARREISDPDGLARVEQAGRWLQEQGGTASPEDSERAA